MGIVSATHKGALWRDEVNSLEIASQPTIAGVWSLRAFDSCPTLYHLIIRAWIQIGFGDAMGSLRALGLLAIMCVVASIWIASLAITGRPPLLALALLGLLPDFIRYAGSNRAYGFGITASILAFAAIWRFVERPGRGRFVVVLLAGMLSVSLLYQNSFLLLSMGLSGALVAAWHRSWKSSVLVLLAGAVAGCCLLPYISTIHEVRDMDVLIHSFVTDPPPHVLLFRRLVDVLATASRWTGLFWLLAVGAATVVTISRLLFRAPGTSRSLRTDRALYAVATLLICAAATTAFYLKSRYTVQPWHLLASIALGAICLDIAITALFDTPRRWASLIGASVLAAIAVPALYEKVQLRHTNMDAVGAIVSAQAQPDDLVVVLPYHPAVAFQHYYDGKAPWTVVPAIGHPPVHRADLVKKKMQLERPIDDVLNAMSDALRRGGTVWLVEQAIHSYAPQTNAPATLPKPPLNKYRWSEQPYSYSWSNQVHYFLQTHATTDQAVTIPSAGPLDGLENMVVRRFSGWDAR